MFPVSVSEVMQTSVETFERSATVRETAAGLVDSGIGSPVMTSPVTTATAECEVVERIGEDRFRLTTTVERADGEVVVSDAVPDVQGSAGCQPPEPRRAWLSQILSRKHWFDG